MHQKRIKVNDLSVDIHEWGVKNLSTTLVMVHGIGVSGAYFTPLAKALLEDYHILVIDLPGYGNTPKPPRPLDIPELARILEEILDSYKLKKLVLIGQSMGCQTVAQLAKSNPIRYSEVILIGPTVNRKERSRVMQALRLFQDTFHEPLSLNTIIVRDYMKMGMLRYLATSSFMLANDIEKNIKRYPGHLLIVRGENDNISPHDWCNHLVNIAQKGDFVEIPNAAHVAQYTKPKELGDACRKFLNL